jgi:Spy/CpxP family protein refolding chaperone
MNARTRCSLGLGLAGLSLLLAGAGLVRAEPQERDGGARMAGGLVERHAERLGLDASTLASVQQIVRESGARDSEFSEQIAAARVELRGLFEREGSLAAVLAQAEKIGALETEARKSRLRALMDVRAKLTPEQLAELVLIRDEVRAQRATLGACAADVRELCGESESGTEVLGCMQNRWSELSSDCQSALTRAPEESHLTPADEDTEDTDVDVH